MSEYLPIKKIAEKYRHEVREQIEQLNFPIRIVGLLASENAPSLTYSKYTQSACENVGIKFDLITASRLQLENEIEKANADDSVHAVMVYYPVFGTQQDTTLKDMVDPKKDVEGLTTFWTRKLYKNDRTADGRSETKAILPCTALSITKVIEESPMFIKDSSDGPLTGKTVTIFNRSEVVGRPLAAMLSNDGATVYSFDIDGPLLFTKGNKVEEVNVSRSSALKQSDIVVTGVPSQSFEKVSADEISEKSLCINFSSYPNFAEDVKHKAAAFYNRVGLVTVTMCLRNAVRIVENFHGDG